METLSVGIGIPRRLLLSLAPVLPLLPPLAARAALFQMPPPRLVNRYFLVRSGESMYESSGVIVTNPVAKTSVDSGLSSAGARQAAASALELKRMGACDGSCWIWPSITQRSYQTAEIIAYTNGVDRSRIVPEYSFLDARGLGALEGRGLDSVSEEYGNMDPNNNSSKYMSSSGYRQQNKSTTTTTSGTRGQSFSVYSLDSISPRIKPPPIDDGTPNESVSDVFVRVTQLMSILETQYSGDTVIIVSPDSDNLTILQAGLIGLDLRRHNELSFGPGDVRLVDPKSIPVYKQPASGVYKCTNPPSCT